MDTRADLGGALGAETSLSKFLPMSKLEASKSYSTGTIAF